MLTDEQRAFSEYIPGAFVIACPGAGKTRTIVARIKRIATTLPKRRGIAVLSFTNTAIEEFISRCYANGLHSVLKHPGFVGTFDSFLRYFFFMPSGLDNIDIRPTVVDSWKTFDVEIRLVGQNAFRGSGVGLDLFDVETNRIDPTTIQHPALRAHVQLHQDAYQQVAERRRRALHQKGYLSAADVRVIVVQRLQRADWSEALGQALAARFQEVIVDEAQDCNSLDCQIISWLRSKGVSVTVVADPDQGIFEFRNGTPGELRVLENNYDPLDRLVLTGNFRSSPSICNIAATLRSRAEPDRSIGETAVLTNPIHVLFYPGGRVSSGIGSEFGRLMEISNILKKDGIVLAHKRINALRACGSGAEEDGGISNVSNIARAVGTFWSSSASGRARESALIIVERTILDLMGKIGESEMPSRATEQRGIDQRWLRRNALELISKIPRTCEDTDEARAAWITTLQEEVRRLHLTYRQGTSERRYLVKPRKASWSHLLNFGDTPDLRSATIHEAKGKEYDAVCVIIPPDYGGAHRTEQLITSWENRDDYEAKRVIYVGITRAKKMGAIAIPVAFRDRMVAILQIAQTSWEEHNL